MLKLVALLMGVCVCQPPQSVVRLSVAEAAAEVDRLFERSWQSAGVQPAERSSDEEFVRRLYLDLAGRIPAVSEVRQFLGDDRPDKRSELVD